MRPNDFLEYRCPTTGIVWQWRIHSIKLGAAKQESLIEVSPVMASDGETLVGKAGSVWVPEPMTRHLKLIARDGYGVPEDDDPEPNPDCPPQEYRTPDDMASNIVASSFDPSPFLDIMDSPLEDSPLRRQIRRRVEQEVEEACNELGFNRIKPPHFDKEQAASGIEALAQYASSPEKQVRTAARLWRDTVRNLDHSNIIRATSEMRTIIARIEAEATETEDDGA